MSIVSSGNTTRSNGTLRGHLQVFLGKRSSLLHWNYKQVIGKERGAEVSICQPWKKNLPGVGGRTNLEKGKDMRFWGKGKQEGKKLILDYVMEFFYQAIPNV